MSLQAELGNTGIGDGVTYIGFSLAVNREHAAEVLGDHVLLQQQHHTHKGLHQLPQLHHSCQNAESGAADQGLLVHCC